MGTNAQFVVIWDPENKKQIGTVLEGDKAVVARRCGISMLPINMRALYGIPPGFFYRPWGDGWIYDGMLAERGCPMMLLGDTQNKWLYWMAAVRPIRPNFAMTGQLRLVGNGATGAVAAGISQDIVPPRLETIAPGSWLIGGRSLVSVVSSGMLGLSIYGSASNCKLEWSACSIALEQIEFNPLIKREAKV